MAIQTLDTIKEWFKTGLKPKQQQFWDTWDSFRHKNEKVPVKDVEGIDELLTSNKIIPSGQYLIFKVDPNTNNKLEIGDSVIGYCEGNFLCEATYYGGDQTLISSFQPIKEAIIETVTLVPLNSNGGTNLFYNNIENHNGILENIVRYLTPEYNYLDPINQGPLPSPYNAVAHRVSGLKIADFMVMNSNTMKSILSQKNTHLKFQFLINVGVEQSPTNINLRLHLSGSLTDQFKTLESSYRLVEYSNNGTYRETDLESNWLGEWETLIRIKTKI